MGYKAGKGYRIHDTEYRYTVLAGTRHKITCYINSSREL
jgi:hypothetical protein